MDDETTEEVIEGFAQRLWAGAIIEAWERGYEDGSMDPPPWSGGGSIDPYIPDPADAVSEAAAEIVRAPGVDVGAAYEAARRSRYGPNSPQEFGSALAACWTGAGDCQWRSFLDVGHGEIAVSFTTSSPDRTNEIIVDYLAGDGVLGTAGVGSMVGPGADGRLGINGLEGLQQGLARLFGFGRR